MKPWYKQKTTLAGIGAVVTGIGQMIAGDYAGGSQMVVIGLIGIFGRQAVNRIGS